MAHVLPLATGLSAPYCLPPGTEVQCELPFIVTFALVFPLYSGNVSKRKKRVPRLFSIPPLT